jgi:sulfate adenylyltransferase
MNEASLPPHGGRGLISRILPELERDRVEQESGGVYHISDADLSIFHRIADGALSPLEGPMDSAAFHRVLDEGVIESNGKDCAWTIPIAFPIARKEADRLEIGEIVSVKQSNDETIGVLEISDIYPFDRERYNRCVYGTERDDHPGARIFNDDPRDYLLGGTIWAFRQTFDSNFNRYMLTQRPASGPRVRPTPRGGEADARGAFHRGRAQSAGGSHQVG